MSKIFKFTKERNDALRALDLVDLKRVYIKWGYLKPDTTWDPRVQEVLMHKMRVNLDEFNSEEKRVSYEWLVERHLSTRLLKVPPKEQFLVHWVDLGETAKSPPDTRYLKGMRVDVSAGLLFTCIVNLPYPARRVGQYHIGCRLCGMTCLVTTAGRLDDPLSVRLGCKGPQP